VDAINSLFTSGIVGMMIDCLKVIGIIFSIWLFSETLGIITIILLPIIYAITRLFQKRMLKAQIENRILVGKVNNHISESLKNAQMIKVFSKENYMERKYTEHLLDNYKTVEKVNFYDSVFPPMIQITRAVVIAIIVILSSKQLNTGYSIVLGSGDITLVSYMSSDSYNGKLFTQSFLLSELMIIKNSCYLYIFTLLISIIISVLMAINKNEKDEIKYFSEYDVMTGVYNRRAGFEKLSQLYKNIGRENCIISVCFIDINGLKEVNDALGHEAGDELILSVIAGIKKNIRNHDFVARLGGDEFLIIFEGLNESKSEETWGRIIKEYNEINDTEKRKYIISVSHGIEVFNCDSNQFIDEIVNSADEKMYNEKREIKKNLNVLRQL